GAALPADARDDGRPRLAPIRARPTRALDVQPGVLEIEVAANAVRNVAADDAVATELGDGRTFGVEQLAPQTLVGLRLLLDRSVGLVVETRREAVAAEAVQTAHPLGRVLAHPVLVDQLVETGESRLRRTDACR